MEVSEGRGFDDDEDGDTVVPCTSMIEVRGFDNDGDDDDVDTIVS